MKKEGGKKKWIIITIIIIILLIIAGIIVFFLINKSGGSDFGFNGFDFSASSKALNSIGEAANKNTFDNAKLNPFSSS